jgi:hypothetical protein
MARIGAQQLSLRRIANELGISPALLVYGGACWAARPRLDAGRSTFVGEMKSLPVRRGALH